MPRMAWHNSGAGNGGASGGNAEGTNAGQALGTEYTLQGRFSAAYGGFGIDCLRSSPGSFVAVRPLTNVRGLQVLCDFFSPNGIDMSETAMRGKSRGQK